MITKDVVLKRSEIMSEKTLLSLLRQHEPGCVISFEGVKQRPYNDEYILRFSVDEDCLGVRQFSTDDMIGADFVIEGEDVE